jgi:anti-sigma factor RsiW
MQLCGGDGFRKDVTMSLPDQNRPLEAVWRGRLTAEQEAQLRAHFTSHPEDRASWEDELSLNHLLRQAPDAPLASNFTAQVLQAVAQSQNPCSAGLPEWLRRLALEHWLLKTATLAAALCLGAFGYHEHQLSVRKEAAQTLATMALAGNSLELLQNFDAIQRLAVVPQDVDRKLIAALQ